MRLFLPLWSSRKFPENVFPHVGLFSPIAIFVLVPKNVLFISNSCVWLCLIKWVDCVFDASVDWLDKSKEPMCCWLVALTTYKTQFLIGLAGQSVKPNGVLAWLWMFWVLGYVWASYFPSALWNHAQLGGGSDAKRLMSTLAYGWVERCIDVASCGPTSFPDKYSYVFNLFNELLWIKMNMMNAWMK